MRIFKAILAIPLLMLTLTVSAQSMSKSYKTVKVERQIDAPAERVWEALVGDYGEISNFSPFIYTSEYAKGSLKGELGASRKCAFNAKGTQWTREVIKQLDNENRRMKNVIVEANKFPLDLDNSYAIYYVDDNGDGTSTAGYIFHFRTKPAIMGAIAKGSFQKSLNETLIGLNHYLKTGERVTGGTDNAKAVLKAYKKAGEYKNYSVPEANVTIPGK